ncbi:hypothetical protein M407DRAFT_28334 [Tulasnella calospora MUT 4182]|uniref:Protein kinase domain-containing protein n=1 Tax=Tulasnella calospora MUT 4182 TaxID=1051891 RepID=A0A0C3QC78_9AGAM|nr:hypothetical protein M407DRAFT_28334 [Tulasnella calospora MUT 4182]
MRRFASKLLAIDGRPNEDNDRNHDAVTGSDKERIPTKRSVRERLDSPGVSSFRIHSKEIKFTSTTSHGSGGKADVAQATFKSPGHGGDEQLVAVKIPHSIKTNMARNEFLHEVEVLAVLSHKNIVQLIGFVEDLEKGIAWIVLSWAPNGNVGQFLANGDWEIPERVSLIQDTFEGIRYLHSRQPPICHGDLKSLNILVSSSHRAVLTDFGSARAIIESEDEVVNDVDGQQMPQGSTIEQACPPIHVAVSGSHLTLTASAWTLRWAPPEVVNGKRPGLSSDIWAAGWVCWEVMTNKLPFFHLESVSDITLRVIRGRVPSPYEDAQLASIGALCSLMKDCWALDPKVRPDISRCCTVLKWMPSGVPSGGNSFGPKAPSILLFLQMGQIEFRQASYEKAASLFQQALSLATSEGNQTGAGLALRLLGEAYRLQSKYSEAKESYTRAEEIFVHTGQEEAQATTLANMGRLSIHRSELAHAEQLFTRAKEIFARLGDEHGQAISLRGLGEVFSLQSKYTQGEELYSLAQELFARAGDDNGRANALVGLGEVYREQSKYPQAEESYNEARDLFLRLGHAEGRAVTLAGLGRVCSSQSRHTQAEEFVTQAQEIYVRLGQDSSQARTLVRLGDIYCVQLKYAKAEEVYTRAQDIYARLGDELGQANVLDELATVYRLQSKYPRAEELLTRAEEIYAHNGDDKGRASTVFELGRICRLQSKFSEAEELYTRAQEIYKNVGSALGQATALFGLGDLYLFQTKYTQAEDSFTPAQEIYTSICNIRGRADTLYGMGLVRHNQRRNVEAASYYVEARDLYTQLGMTDASERVSLRLADVLPDQNSSVTSPHPSVQVLSDIPSTSLLGKTVT